MNRKHEDRSPGAVVIGGNNRALGVVRSLGRRGIPVWVLTDDHRVAAYSRYCRGSRPWPPGGEQQRVTFLLELAARHGLDRWMVFPTMDFTAALIAKHHAQLSQKYLLTTPPWDDYVRVCDKEAIHRLAGTLGIDQPDTRYPRSRDEVASLDCEFPAIIKPSLKEGDLNRFTFAKAWRVNNRDELLARYDEACCYIDPGRIMVQEYIPAGVGHDYSYGALCDRGRSLASIVAWRPRQHPLEFTRGATYVETVHLPELEAAAQRLLEAIEFTGMIEVAFLRDPRDGRYKLLDLNPRAWGWHTIGHRAGVDFPYLLWRLMNGEEVAPARATVGVKWIRMSTDIPTVIRMVRRGLISPADYLRSLRGAREYAIFASDDPVPALVDAPLLARLAIERALA